jgi:hypothetical protein
MTKQTKKAAPPESVDAYLAASDHPQKPALVELRELTLSADPSITDGIKWNVPSFRTTEWFATYHVRLKQGVGVILHLGAKKRNAKLNVSDPSGLLQWLADDRAMVVFDDLADVKRKKRAYIALIREWIRQL